MGEVETRGGGERASEFGKITRSTKMFTYCALAILAISACANAQGTLQCSKQMDLEMQCMLTIQNSPEAAMIKEKKKQIMKTCAPDHPPECSAEFEAIHSCMSSIAKDVDTDPTFKAAKSKSQPEIDECFAKYPPDVMKGIMEIFMPMGARHMKKHHKGGPHHGYKNHRNSTSSSSSSSGEHGKPHSKRVAPMSSESNSNETSDSASKSKEHQGHKGHKKHYGCRAGRHMHNRSNSSEEFGGKNSSSSSSSSSSSGSKERRRGGKGGGSRSGGKSSSASGERNATAGGKSSSASGERKATAGGKSSSASGERNATAGGKSSSASGEKHGKRHGGKSSSASGEKGGKSSSASGEKGGKKSASSGKSASGEKHGKRNGGKSSSGGKSGRKFGGKSASGEKMNGKCRKTKEQMHCMKTEMQKLAQDPDFIDVMNILLKQKKKCKQLVSWSCTPQTPQQHKCIFNATRPCREAFTERLQSCMQSKGFTLPPFMIKHHHTSGLPEAFTTTTIPPILHD